MVLGEYERVVTMASENIAALPSDWIYQRFGGGTPRSVFDRHLLVQSLAALGRFSQASEYETEMLRLAESTRHAQTIGLAHLAARTPHVAKGEWAQARSLIEHLIVVARTGNLFDYLFRAVASSAFVLARLGEVGAASSRLREGEGLVERAAAQGHRNISEPYRDLGRACFVLGWLDDARRLGDRAFEYSQSASMAWALHFLGDIETHPDRFDAERGEGHYRQALALAEPRGMRPLVAHCHRGLGKLYGRTGKRQEAQEHLTTATSMYREMDMRFWLAQADAEKSELTE
jgi:tetratricopeptide (TPR) repeat protein